MKIVLDANILMSALIKDSFTREFIVKSDHLFFVPETVFKTLLKYKQLVLKKTNADSGNLDSLIKELFRYIKILDLKGFENELNRAEDVMGDIDVEDAVFVACALSIPDSVIWSNDKHLKKQSLVQVYTTKEILRI